MSSRTWTGREIVMETLVAEGVEYLFGNPGTTELPLMDALEDYPSIRYVLALQEAIAVSMADAWAQATGRVGVANLHVGPGLGNGMGSLYNAWEGRTPLVVTAGQQDTRFRLREPVLWHDLVAMAAPVTKWSAQAESAGELPELLHRAFKIAQDPPTGPVFVALPFNVMNERTSRGPIPPSRIWRRAGPDPEGVAEAARLVLGAARPVLFAGDRVAQSGAVAELMALAERIGADVYGEVLPVQVNAPSGHPCVRAHGFGDHAQVRAAVGDADLVLLVGGEFFEEVWYVEDAPFPEGAPVIQIDPSARNLGRNHRLDCGLFADPKLALAALDTALEAGADDAYRAGAAARMERIRGRKEEEARADRARAERPAPGNRPMSAAQAMHELARAAPAGVAVAREAITAGRDLVRSFGFRAPGDAIGSRGGGIGQGLPTGIGLKLARPERPVLCVSGDGSALYTIQALWTAAHHRVPVVFVIVNNRVYRILKYNMNRFRAVAGVEGRAGSYRHLDLTDPDVDYVSVARGFGVEGRRVSAPEEIGPAVEEAFASGAPRLLELVVDGSV